MRGRSSWITHAGAQKVSKNQRMQDRNLCALTPVLCTACCLTASQRKGRPEGERRADGLQLSMGGGKRKEFSSSVCLIFCCLCFPMPESVIKSFCNLK